MTVRIVNDGLPHALYLAILRQQRPYNPDPYSITVTELLAPPRARALLRQAHATGTVIEIPASRLVPAFLGTCLHAGLGEPLSLNPDEIEPLAARAAREGSANPRREQRLHASVVPLAPDGSGLHTWRVSGQPDLIDQDGIIHDYKLTKVYALKDGWVEDPMEYGSSAEFCTGPRNWCGKEEWVQQLNLYAELARRQNPPIPVRGLRLTAFLKDYQEKGFKKNGAYFPSTREQYPWLPSDTTTLHVPLWPTEQATAFLHERLAAHEAAMNELPLCTSGETWGGRKCEGWCDAAAVCGQYQATRMVPDYDLVEALEKTLTALKGD
jgi:hypothetical protein